MDSRNQTPEEIHFAPFIVGAFLAAALISVGAYYLAMSFAPANGYVKSGEQGGEDGWPRVQKRFHLSDHAIGTLKRIVDNHRDKHRGINAEHVERAFVLVAGRNPVELDTLRRDLRVRVLRQARGAIEDIRVLNVVELIHDFPVKGDDPELRSALRDRPKFLGKLGDLLGPPDPGSG